MHNFVAYPDLDCRIKQMHFRVGEGIGGGLHSIFIENPDEAKTLAFQLESLIIHQPFDLLI